MLCANFLLINISLSQKKKKKKNPSKKFTQSHDDYNSFDLLWDPQRPWPSCGAI